LSLAALALALAAAALHAAWNTAVAGRRDPEAAAAALLICAIGLFLVPAVLTWRISAEAWPYVIASALLHFGYFAGLAAAYSRADLSVVYPVARGVGPVVVLVVGALALGKHAGAGQAAGVMLVAIGVLLVRGPSGDLHVSDLALALFVAACIGGYTLVDSYGVKHAAPVTYLELSNGGVMLLYVPLVGKLRGPAALRRELRPQAIAAGGAAFGAYALVLTALKLAPPAAVAAVRESSVVIAAFLARGLLDEPVGPRRMAGAASVAAGIALIALS
jgi:drug/metabolite transporter (DMT)-like permease